MQIKFFKKDSKDFARAPFSETKNGAGFTLIELLVVITIIGTLSGVVLVSLTGVRSSARDAVRQSDMRQVVSAEGIFFGFNERYFAANFPDGGTPDISNYLVELHDTRCPGGNCIEGATDYAWYNNTQILTCDNKPNRNAAARQWFCAYATLEEKSSTSPSNKIYYRSSHRGTKKLDLESAPSITGDCTCFD
jgi:prepilin-type N-terminal cleavage/methylation domain-containing protein